MPKRSGNVERDRQHIEQLTVLGWQVLVIWEYATLNTQELGSVLSDFLKKK